MKHPVPEDELHKCVVNERANELPVSRSMILVEAKKIYNNAGVEFSGSEG